MAKGESVSFFFPAYYDEKSIPKLAREFYSALEKTGRDFEVVVIDDCGPDKTGEVADALAGELPKLRVVHHEKNRGYGGVLITGFGGAKKELVGFTDGDAQYSVKDLPKFLDGMNEADLVIGYRVKRADKFSRTFFQKIYKMFLLVFFGLRVRDPDCSFKMMRTGVFPKIKPVSKSGFFSAEMLCKAKKQGLRVKEVPVTHLERKFGESTFFGWRRVLAMFTDMLKVRFGKT